MDAHARIQEFSPGGGGVHVSLTKNALCLFVCFVVVFLLFFLVLSFFYRSQKVNFKGIYHFIFQGSRGGPTFSRVGPTFSRGGGPIAYSL